QQRSLSSNKDVVEFCALLRQEKFNVGVQETLAAVAAIKVFEGQNRETVRAATRSVLSSSKEEWDRFDALFERFWDMELAGCKPETRQAASNREQPHKEKKSQEDGRQGIATGLASESDQANEGESVSGASAIEKLRKTDFSKAAPAEIAELERIALRLLNQMSARLSRRLKISVEGQLDLRRTIRRSIGRGGDPLDLSFRGKKRRRPKLVLMIDVSGSMQLHSFFLLMLAYALQKHLNRVESLVFSTGPVNVTDSVKSRSLHEALASLSDVTAGWSGGTRIGETLRELNLNPDAQVWSHDTVFIMCSDGLDTGEPDILEQELATVKRRVRKIIWLTPLLGMKDYQPITRGISAALPLIDVFAACHDLDSLLELEKLL
ncbi:MAG TPA: VWA domain-containing protein, partial [Blastocatellia bacterium]|nr:VWA domain-containing protein [Blastocatellia bacterium]